MRTDQAITLYRKDYQPPAFWVDHVALDFHLDAHRTIVRSTLQMRPNTNLPTQQTCVLQGEDLALQNLFLNQNPLQQSDYTLSEDGKTLTLHTQPAFNAPFTLRIEVIIDPASNTQLMGLYQSNGNLFTQCEAEGFRRITFFPDRPDVMARYKVRLQADKVAFPILLSNGNLIEQGELANGQHYACWEDPFPKPCYLFALVAGQLVCREHTLVTSQGEKLLQIWVRPADLDKTEHALQSLIHSIAWDERRFGLPLDLERFMIVAVSDFNMGAMENKGLNIFNTKFVLADAQTATDVDFYNIESVVGHEYFHNWTGNRVTCRDWFQLSLKEGLTVFRDQEFSMDMASNYGADPSARAVCRIQDVRTLRSLQFPEDAGPMAHPVRPDSYQEINNFYTMTIYEKGAEVVRMYQTLLGPAGFRKGMDLYFARHDGQAVTCDDFLAAMHDANHNTNYTGNTEAEQQTHAALFEQFSRWYAQAGTPRLRVRAEYNAARQEYTLLCQQNCPATAGQARKQPFVIPLKVGLLNAQDGTEMQLQLSTDTTDSSQSIEASAKTTRVLHCTQAEQRFVFTQIPSQPIPSLLRDFSAPVILDAAYTDAELAFLAKHDTDAFNRWEAIQQLAVRRILAAQPIAEDDLLIQVFQHILSNPQLSPAFQELACTLPSESYLAEQVPQIDAPALHAAREQLRATLASRLESTWHSTYQQLAQDLAKRPYQADFSSSGQRALKNLALHYLVTQPDSRYTDLAYQQYQHANNMTDRFAALTALVNSTAPQRAFVLTDFATRFSDQALVMDKWFTAQATRMGHPALPTVLEDVQLLLQHPAFSLKNPNKVRALISAFCQSNPAQFHMADGSGYRFWAAQIVALDRINPQVAARLARALDHWKKHSEPQRSLMQQALTDVASTELSADTREVISKSLS